MYASTTVYGKETLLIDSDIQVIFIAYGFHLYNLSDIAVYQGREDEFRDTVHMTDVMAAKMTLYLGLHDPTIGSVVDVTKLRDSIKHQKNGFLNF